jgi:hypothetical protein
MDVRTHSLPARSRCFLNILNAGSAAHIRVRLWSHCRPFSCAAAYRHRSNVSLLRWIEIYSRGCRWRRQRARIGMQRAVSRSGWYQDHGIGRRCFTIRSARLATILTGKDCGSSGGGNRHQEVCARTYLYSGSDHTRRKSARTHDRARQTDRCSTAKFIAEKNVYMVANLVAKRGNERTGRAIRYECREAREE